MNRIRDRLWTLLAIMLVGISVQAMAADRPMLPAVMHVCSVEPTAWDPCSDWTLSNGGYDAVWQDINITARVSVVDFTPDWVSLTRQDFGRSRSLYHYVGKLSRQGDSIVGGEVESVAGQIVGHFTATWGDAAVAQAQQEKNARPLFLPTEMEVCSLEPVKGGSPCGKFTLDNGRYRAEWHDFGTSATITIDRFTNESVLWKAEFNQGQGTFYYVGKISAAGNSIEKGEMRDIDARLQGHFNATWSNTIPATRADVGMGAVIRDNTADRVERKFHNRDPLLTRPNVIRVCEGACIKSMGSCDGFVEDYCGTGVWDRNAFDTYWRDGLRERIAVEKWQDGEMHLKVIDDPVHPADTDEFTGSLSDEGAFYGVQRVTRPGHWQASNIAPGVHEFGIKVEAVSPDAEPPPPCNAENAKGDFAYLERNTAKARRMGDALAARCWNRFAAEQGDGWAFVQRSYDSLFGTGDGDKSNVDAMLWAQKAIDLKSTLALMIGARLYRQGLGVARNPQKADALEAQYEEQYAQGTVNSVRRLSNTDQARRCEDDWGLMSQMGFDCYAIIRLVLERSNDDNSRDANRECKGSLNVGNCEDAVHGDIAERRDVFESNKNWARGICKAYSGTKFRNGEQFDEKRCNAAAYVKWSGE